GGGPGPLRGAPRRAAAPPPRAVAARPLCAPAPPANLIVGISKETGIPIGTRWPLVEGMSGTEVYRTGRSARVDGIDWTEHPESTVAKAALRFGVTVQVSCPIIVEGSVWGVVTLNAGEELPPDTDQRLERFTELVTTAI